MGMGKTVEGDDPQSANVDQVKIDMENRDPNNLNDHIQTRFEDTIGEPIGAHSADCVWLNSYKAYKLGSDCCYTCLTYVCSIPHAFCWGCYFACLTFFHIWTVTPWLRAFKINFSAASRFFSALVHCFCDPFYEALSLMFTKIYVNVNHDTDGYKERTYSGLRQFSGPVDSKGSPIMADRKRSGVHGSGYDNKAAEADMYDDVSG